MRQKIFIFLFFSFFSNFVQNNITEYLYGNPLKDNQNEEGEHDDCDCIVENNKCNYLCCCDKKCPSEAITDWKNHFKCTDERDVVGIFEDRCIDKNLVFKNWSTRGLYIETETEDILHNVKKTLKNYCYATDNSGNMAKNLIRIDELDKHGYKNIYGENSENSEDLLNNIIGKYVKTIFLKNYITSNNSSNLAESDENKSYITINNDSKIFNNNGFFSLYSGQNCQTRQKSQIMLPQNYTCMMDPSIGETLLNELNDSNREFNFISHYKNILCKYKGKKYILDENNIFSKNNTGDDCQRVLEVEFVFYLKDYEFSDCSLYVLCSNQNYRNDNNSYLFKNSIVFRYGNDNNNYMKCSGSLEYYNGYPLIFSNSTHIFNDFYIIGRYKNGSCRMDDNLNDYLYNSDGPIIFNQDYIYKCNGTNINIKETTLYKKLNTIHKISINGACNLNTNSSDWIEVDKNKLENINTHTHIIMNIYIKKKKTGIYNHKYISKVNFETKNSNDVIFEVKYHNLDDDNTKKYNKNPYFPAFIPSIPEDILAPLIYSEVDK